MLVTHSTNNLDTHQGQYNTLVLIVNGYQLLCDADTVLEQHRGTVTLFLFYSLSSFSIFAFYVFATLTVLFLFLGASIVCVNNLKGTADLVL